MTTRYTQALRHLLAACVLLPTVGVHAAEVPSDARLDEQRFFEQKCCSSHPSKRIFLIKLSPEMRRHVVLRMRERVEPGAA